MQAFLPGQRWVSQAEPDLGLGFVVNVEQRTVSLMFPACGETRTYARQSTPLSRVRYAPADTISDDDGRSLVVDSVEEKEGLLHYSCRDADDRALCIDERRLNATLQLNRPTQRLFSFQFDAAGLFSLRHDSWRHRHQLGASDLYGLTGCRTQLIPHQLYIAHEVAGRHAPRVLLADEVGLGKTIEAGLILHQQLLSERARRVLILVPESLLHQWLVEMLRRFNLLFSLFDDARCQSMLDQHPDENPFHSEQRVLCSLDLLRRSPGYAELALAGDWDLLVVDEAHHLAWSPHQASDAYRLVEQLAGRTPGVLLLTATPEQLGRAGHFARLRLLDPHRFPDLDRFLREEERYAPVARAVEHLVSDTPLDGERVDALKTVLREDDTDALLAQLLNTRASGADHTRARHTLIDRLLDQHGTGRILFRNTRAAVEGFAKRLVRGYPLPLPPGYADCLRDAAADLPPARLAAPERHFAQRMAGADWTTLDPRVSWLSTTVRALKPEKVLVIAASAQTAVELADALYSRHGLHVAVFHEGLTLVERDRAAAFFADRETGTQVMICSEIGSEGRNFQFAHHLVLFDLPLNPDLLEQRIGRLDRIGQTQTVRIHAPYLDDSAQAVLFHWYQDALNAFEHTCPAGPQILAEVERTLLALCRAPHQPRDALMERSRQLNQALNQALQAGRDRLLEYSSCRQPAADRLCERAREMEDPAALSDYTETLLDAFGVELRPHSAGCQIATPGDHMAHPLPGLPDDGITFTCDRDIALAFEDATYLSWEHPLVRTAMDMLLTSELGNCSLATLRDPSLRPGTLLLECLYVIEGGHRALARQFHLGPIPVHLVVDEQGRPHHARLTLKQISAGCAPVDNRIAQQVVQARETRLRELLDTCSRLAAKQAPALLAAAGDSKRQVLHREIDRLLALSRVNPNVRPEEIDYFRGQLQQLTGVEATATPRLDAVRVLVAT